LDSRSRAADLLALVPAAAIPLVFLHRRYQAHTSIGPVDLFGSDVAIALTVLAALAAAVLLGWRRLLVTRTLWLIAGSLLALFVVSCFWTPLDDTTDHLVTAAKVVEYALLAPALVLLFRRRVHVDRFLIAFVAWSAAASAWGLLQFLGVVAEFEGKRPGQREVSFLGIHDFAAFASATLAIGFAGVALAERRRLTIAAIAAGGVGAMLAASIFAYSGVVLAAIAAVVIGRRMSTLTLRRGLAIAGIAAVVGVGVLGLRSYDVTSFLSYFGVGAPEATASEDVQSGSQRAMLAYIGLRIWQDHPVLGAGFGRSTDGYGPYLADAKRRFPDQPPQAYPSREHPWGVQNFWIQLLADVGVVGFALGIATFISGLVLAFRAPPALAFFALVAAGWILVAAGTWNALGIVAGIPLQAVTWLGLGLAATITAGLE
jgi:O-Antigen ligase